MPLNIIRNDITKIPCDAIVNAANKSLLGGGGVDGAIHKAAGIGLFFDCLKLRGCKVGDAKITPAHKLPCKYVIHTVGPKWKDGTHGEAELLADCYLKSLTLAKEHECESVAFPLISTGVYKFPKAEALKIAVDTISKFLEDNDMEVTIVVYEKSDFQIDASLDEKLSKFIDEKYEGSFFDARFGTGKIGLPFTEEEHSVDYMYPQWDLDDSWLDSADFSADIGIPKEIKRESSPAFKKRSRRHRVRTNDFLRRRKKKRKNKDSSDKPNINIEGTNTVNITPIIDRTGSMHDTSELDLSEALKRFGENSTNDEVFLQRRRTQDYHVGTGAVREKHSSLEEMLSKQDDSFMTALFKKIDEKGIKDSECYIKANMDKKKFYKIKNEKLRISKQTALAFAIALELDLDETKDLINKAGFSLTFSSKFDIIVFYHIKEKIYNIHDINIVLFNYDQVLLG